MHHDGSTPFGAGFLGLSRRRGDTRGCGGLITAELAAVHRCRGTFGVAQDRFRPPCDGGHLAADLFLTHGTSAGILDAFGLGLLRRGTLLIAAPLLALLLLLLLFANLLVAYPLFVLRGVLLRPDGGPGGAGD